MACSDDWSASSTKECEPVNPRPVSAAPSHIAVDHGQDVVEAVATPAAAVARLSSLNTFCNAAFPPPSRSSSSFLRSVMSFTGEESHGFFVDGDQRRGDEEGEK